MKAAIVLLADYKTQNYIRKIVFELNHDYGVEFFASLLPTQVSMKQRLAFECMQKLETCFDSLAERVTPFEIQLDGIY